MLSQKSFYVLFAFCLLSASHAEIGWCGNVWPCDGYIGNAGEGIDVYFQIWKDGVTDADSAAPGDGIFATLSYRSIGEPAWTEMEMTYNVDVGNNDEFTATIPGAELTEGDTIEVYCEGLDTEDMSTCQGNDRAGNPATAISPLIYTPVNPTTIAVTVHFSVNMNGVGAVEPVTLTGTFNGWNPTAIVMSDLDVDGIYEVSCMFPDGSSRNQEYKYINGGTWESSGNRILVIDDSAPDMYLPPDYFGNMSTVPVCVVFRVDVHGYEVVPDSAFIAGNQLPLHWGWDDGWTDADRIYDDGTHSDETAGDSIYTTIIEFPAGTYRDVEYKFSTSGRDNEPLPPYENHGFILAEEEDTLYLPIVIFGSLTGIAENAKSMPTSAALMRNYPNPFNSSTVIEIEVGAIHELSLQNSPASLEIYDIRGSHVRTLANNISSPGVYRIVWDGKDARGEDMPGGLYLYRLQCRDLSLSGKMAMVE